MILEELFSRRYNKENGLVSDVFQYEEVPSKLKITLYKIFQRTIIMITEPPYYPSTRRFTIYESIHNIICEEHSLECLIREPSYKSDYEVNVIEFFKTNNDLLIALDIIQLFCKFIHGFIKSHYCDRNKKKELESILDEINQRMLQHSFGYQFTEGLLIRIDTKHTHNEIVKPALILLNDSRFKNANEEYRAGFEAYKNADYENVFSECNKSFESTMKIICEINEFEYKQSDVSSKLIKILVAKEFIKAYNENMLNGLINVLTTVPTLRNKEGGHGKGVKEKLNDISYVNFALHSTASNILFLMERQKEYDKSKQDK